MNTRVKCILCQDLAGTVIHNDAPYCRYCIRQIKEKALLESKKSSIVGQKVKSIQQKTADEIEFEFENGAKLLIEAYDTSLLKLLLQDESTNGSWARIDVLKLNKGV